MNKFKYQSIKISPQNKVIKVAPTKNGPNGISDLRFFFLKINKIVETTAPLKKAKNKAVKRSENPKSKPIKTPILTSPIPIHLPREIKTIIKKKTPPINPAKNLSKNTEY